MLISSSLLAANFSDLQNELKKVDNSDFLHLDIMDGHFVPNISFGPAIVAGLKSLTSLPYDVHLMLSHPINYVEQFAKAGAEIISFHVECEDDTQAVIEKIKSLGVKPALVVKPNTPIETIFPYCKDIYMVLVMTVEPGFGGQTMMTEQLEKIKGLKEKFPQVLVEVDGGIGKENIELCKNAMVDICVCGTSVFSSENPKETIKFLQSF